MKWIILLLIAVSCKSPVDSEPDLHLPANVTVVSYSNSPTYPTYRSTVTIQNTGQGVAINTKAKITCYKNQISVGVLEISFGSVAAGEQKTLSGSLTVPAVAGSFTVGMSQPIIEWDNQ